MLPSLLCPILILAAIVLADELGLVSIRLESNREKCFKEQLPQNTVALFKYEGTPYIPQANAQPIPQDVANFQTQVTVRDANNNVVSTKVDKPSGRLFFTAPSSGEFQVCFKALQKQAIHPTSYIKFSPEVFIGDAGDPHITPPVALQLSDLSQIIMKANELVGDIEREQALQREREAYFQEFSRKLHRDTIKWSLLQAVILGLTAVGQLYYLSNFFKARKLV